jgi:hypothetical protein
MHHYVYGCFLVNTLMVHNQEVHSCGHPARKDVHPSPQMQQSGSRPMVKNFFVIFSKTTLPTFNLHLKKGDLTKGEGSVRLSSSLR